MIFVIPLVLFIASAVMHGLAMKSGQFTKTLAIMPGLALIFSAGGLLLCQAIIKSKIKDAMSTLADVSGDLSSLFGDSVSNSVSSMIKFQGEIGFWLLVIIAIVLVVEDLVLSSEKKAHQDRCKNQTVCRRCHLRTKKTRFLGICTDTKTPDYNMV